MDAVGDDKPTHVIELTQNARPPIPWTLSVFEDRWVFATVGEAPTTIARDKLRKWVDLEVLATFGILNVTLERKLMFPLKAEGKAILRAWVGPPTREDLVASLRKRYGTSSLVMAGVMVMLATPWFMPAWLATTGADPATRVDWLLILWGATTIAGWGISRIAPHRALFLIDVAVQLGVAVVWGYGVATGQRTWWLALVILMMLFGANLSLRQYKRFTPLG